MLKGLFKKKNVQLMPPIVGQIIPLEEVPDTVFSGKMIGEGFAIQPKDGKVIAPVDAEIIQLFPTKHAIGLRTPEGLEFLIHVGIDTVDLKGEGFKAFIAAGDHVKAGDVMLEVDFEFIESKGKSTITPVVFTEKEQYKTLKITYGSCQSGKVICEIGL